MINKHPNLISKQIAGTALALSLAVAPALSGKAVNSELLLLVDVSGSISNTEYNTMMSTIAQSFEGSSVIDSISYGGLTSVAASLVFWSSSSNQEVGVSWMEIGSAASAQNFATAVRAAVRPFRGGASIAAALDFATPLFGTETGGVGNGFESARQSITLIGDSTENGSNGAARVSDARARAVAAGVDQISAIALNNNSGFLANYYLANVIGGAPGTSSTLANVSLNGNPQSSFDQTVTFSGTGGNPTPAVAVPEPSSILLLAGGLFGLLARRNR